MKKLLSLTILLATFSASSQQISTDLLRAPASPAASLLGIANTEINKPTDVPNLMLGLQNLSSIIAKEQGGYALDFSPYWLFPAKKSDKTIGQMLNDSVRKNIPQTLSFSFGVQSSDSTSTQLPANSVFSSFGFKFSILRGKVDQETKSVHEKIVNLLKYRLPLLFDIDKEVERDSLYRAYRKQMDVMLQDIDNNEEKEEVTKSDEYRELETLQTERDSTLTADLTAFNKALLENQYEIQSLQNTFRINRTGFVWDIAGGSSLRFRNKSITNSAVYNAGIWTVLGYATAKAGTPLFLARYMYNPDAGWLTTEGFERTGDFSTFDIGLKYEYNPEKSKFTAGLEGLRRSFLSGSTIKPTWKLIFNANYALWPNQIISFSFGKNFDNHIIKEGNLITALSFISGIGTKRKVKTD